MRRRILEIGGGAAIPPSMSKAADYALYDRTAQKIIIVDGNEDLAGYPSSLFAPIGVVIVPGSHDVYGDGSCGVMSLKEMSYNTPDEGKVSYDYIYWGGYMDSIPLPDLNQVPTGNTSNGIPTGQNNYAYLPSDEFSDTQCAHDTDTFYDSSPYAPSPYLTDGSRNPGYYQTTSPSSVYNALADFDGIGNSQVLWDLAISQSDWKTASSITNNGGFGYYPAACCCWRYHTEGTSQGDWYLPACGELGYIMPHYNKINEAIRKIQDAYGSSAGKDFGFLFQYWSSTEFSTSDAYSVFPHNGLVNGHDKDQKYDLGVRAWLRVK